MPDSDLTEQELEALRQEAAVMSKEGKVVGRLGNEEVDPFRQHLAESAEAATDEAASTLATELKELAQEASSRESSQNNDAVADIHGHKRKDRPGDQPLPKTNHATDCQTTFRERIAVDVAVRREIGINRYGTALQPFNGRNAMQDAWEEFIDLGQYLEQLRRERHDMIECLRRLAGCRVEEEFGYVQGQALVMLDAMGIKR